MDPFEVRMQFLTLLGRLNASQQSIQKVVGFAIKYFSSCGEDIWECIIEDCQKGSINSRINILYFLDSLCETCLLVKTQQRSQPHPSSTSASHRSSASSMGKPSGKTQANSLYVKFLSRDLSKIVEYVVPEGRQGLPNLVSTKQILENWRSRRLIDLQKVDEALSVLKERATLPPAPPPSASSAGSSSISVQPSTPSDFQKQLQSQPQVHAPPSPPPLSRNDVFKRIEEDRERHKRLRERRWVQPTTQSPFPSNPSQMPLLSFLPLSDAKDGYTGSVNEHGQGQGQGPGPGGHHGEDELAVDIEFENEWESTSDWNEDDDEVVGEERELCFPREGEGPMDLS